MKASDIKRKRKEYEKLRLELKNLEADELVKVGYPKAKKLVGTYWAYLNSYSCPQYPHDYWWLYLRVDSVNKDGTFVVSEFQIDKYGELKAGVKNIPWTRLESGFEKIPQEYYTNAFKNVRILINGLSPLNEGFKE